MVRLLIGSVIALVLGLSFLATRVMDELVPAGSTDVITVWDQSVGPSGEFQDLVARTAEAQDMTVLKEVRTESGAAVVRHEYVANPSAARSFRFADHDVAGFDPSLVTRFGPLSELPSDQLNGMYVTDAGTAAARRFAASLGGEGVTVTVNPLSLPALALWTASEAPVVPLGGALLLVVLVGVVAWQGSRRNVAAIRASFGRTWGSSNRRDAAVLAAGMAAGGVVGIALATPALVVFNGGARIGLFLALTGAGVALTAGLAGLVSLATARCTRTSIAQSISGARPWRSVLVVSLLANVLVLPLASSAAATAREAIALARDDAAEQGDWRSSLDVARLAFFSSIADLDAAEPALAELFTRLDRAGAVVLADHTVLPDPTSHAPDDGNVLLVNAQYLDEQDVRSPSGARVTPRTVDPTALTLLTPEGVRVSERDKEAWREFLRFQRSRSSQPETIPARIELTTLPTATHRVFTYATDDLQATSVDEDTVIAVLPSATPSVSENLIVSDMTSGEVVFPQPDLLRAELARLGLTSAATIQPLRDAVTYRSVVIERGSRWALVAVGVLVVVLAASAASTSRALAMIRRRRTAILRTHGRSMSHDLATALVLPLGAVAAVGSALVLTTAAPERPPTLACLVVDVVLIVAATAVQSMWLARRAARHP